MTNVTRTWSKAAAKEAAKYHKINQVNKPKTGPEFANMSEGKAL